MVPKGPVRSPNGAGGRKERLRNLRGGSPAVHHGGIRSMGFHLHVVVKRKGNSIATVETEERNIRRGEIKRRLAIHPLKRQSKGAVAVAVEGSYLRLFQKNPFGPGPD
mmetsp:Transcript_27674/g.64987  ORF Transcript_27674/g.64987 Transcript_27674/m.64987 type:complete len:108 (-) Transcript_27674:130-453(-)